MNDIHTDPAHSWYSGNIFHYDPFADAIRTNDNDRYWRMDNDPQKRSTKGEIAFKAVWALLFIPIFFWWDEITEMAFIALR